LAKLTGLRVLAMLPGAHISYRLLWIVILRVNLIATSVLAVSTVWTRHCGVNSPRDVEDQVVLSLS